MGTLAAGKSDLGRRRTNNEDAYLLEDDLGLYVVCDGMGGHASGEVASRMALEAVQETLARERPRLEKIRDGNSPADELVELVSRAVQSACGLVYEQATSRPELAGIPRTEARCSRQCEVNDGCGELE